MNKLQTLFAVKSFTEIIIEFKQTNRSSFQKIG